MQQEQIRRQPRARRRPSPPALVQLPGPDPAADALSEAVEDLLERIDLTLSQKAA
jgi:hypothetical protein